MSFKAAASGESVNVSGQSRVNPRLGIILVEKTQS